METAYPSKTFMDSKGRVWNPVVNGRVIRDFELQTGRGLLENVIEVITEFPNEDTEKMDQEQLKAYNYKLNALLYKITANLFGNVGNLLYLLYEALRPVDYPDKPVVYVWPREKESEDIRKEEVNYNEFCSSITGKEIDGVMLSAVMLLLKFFPDPRKGEGGGSEDENPKEVTFGETFLNSPQQLG